MTEPTDASSQGAAPGEGGQDLLAAFLATHDELLDKIYAFIRRRMRHADDDVAGVFLDSVKGFVAYAEKNNWNIPEQDYLPVMIKIASCRIVDSARVRARRQGKDVLSEPSDLDLLTGAISDPYEDVTRRIDVSRALAHLTDQQCRVLVMRFVDQFTLDETAAVMGISTSRIKAITTNAKLALRLRGLLKSYGPPTTRRIPQTGTSEAQA